MSLSPPVRRLPITMPFINGRDAIRHEEELINAFEAEEERITNVLYRKLEQVCLYLAHVPELY